MGELWYYTNDGNQMAPVSIGDLQRLVSDGKLKPTDMVWKDGMPRWIRASTIKELFGGPMSNTQYAAVAAPEKVSTAPASAVKPGAPVAVDEVDPRMPRRRRPQDEADSSRRAPVKAASNTSIIVALVVGALLLVGSLGVGVFILISANQKEGKINTDNVIKGEAKYNLVLAPEARDNRTFSFRKGVDYHITVKTQPQLDGIDVDLHIFNSSGRKVMEDTAPDRDCDLRWMPDADGEYRVEVHNLNQFGKAVQVNCVVVIREFKEAKPIEEKIVPKDPPLPADVMEGRGFKDDFKFSPTKKEEMQKFRVKGKHKATFTFAPANAKGDFNILVVKDSDTNKVIAQDVGAGARASVSFTLDGTEIVQVRIVNASEKGIGANAFKGTLSYDASPPAP